MLSLDIRTLSFLAALSSLMLALGLLLVRRTDSSNPGLRMWSLGASTSCVGYALLALRGVVPDLLSIVVANSLLLFGPAWVYAGLRRFEDPKNDPSWQWFLTAATAALLYYFTYPMPSLAARIVVISAATAAVLFPCATTLLRVGDIHDRMVRWLLAAAYLTTAIFLCVRALATPFITAPGQDFMAVTSLVHTLALAFIIGLNVALGIGLPLLILGSAQRRIETGEDRYRTLVEWSPEPLAVHRGGKLIYVNPAAVKMFGANSAQDLLGKPILELVHPDFHQVVLARAQAAMEKHVSQPLIEEKFLRLDGTAIDVEVQNLTIDYDGEPAIQVAARDITDRRRADAALRLHDSRYRIVVEASGDGFWVVDTEGHLRDVNEAYVRRSGFTREELLGMHVYDLDANETPSDAASHIRTIMSKGGEVFETLHRAKNGTQWPVEVSVSYRADRAEPMLCFVRDITERKQVEEALRQSEKRFRDLIEQSLTGVYISQNGVLVYANPRLEQILGYGPGELLGLRIDDIVFVEDLPILQGVRGKLRAGAKSISYEGRARRKDGSVIELGVQGSANEFNGEPATIGMAQDITEKKRAEAEIRHYIKQLETAFMSTVTVATTLSEMRDPYTAGHERRVAEIAVAIGAELGLDSRRQEGLRVAGHLHDVGKITIPAEILSKPGKLNPIEFKLIQGHAQASYDVLKDVKFPWPVAEVALQHHERIDGSGYPQGLKGDAILFESRIVSVADVIEAMSSHRPYRPGLGTEAALAEIERGRGTAYDPAVVDACMKLFREKGYAVPA